ncbi:hypothetical protein NE865_08574 [Phthorimaea operculella]|nr:hypothetical protein NE865_08574 [Phthorimaea operculella]
MLQKLFFLIIFVFCPELHETAVITKPCPLMEGHGRRMGYRRADPAGPTVSRTYCKPYDNSCNKNYETWPPTTVNVSDSDEMYEKIRQGTTPPYTQSRTTPFRLSFRHDCDYLAYYCMKAYQTGKVCARAFYAALHSFPSYCLLDYVNCMEKFEIWQVIHMGECEQLKPLTEYKHIAYNDDYFLDQYYTGN